MAFDYSKLSGRIIEIFKTRYNFARAMGWSERTLSLKMNGFRTWKQSDICKAIRLLKLTEKDIPTYFFKPEVQNNELERGRMKETDYLFQTDEGR